MTEKRLLEFPLKCSMLIPEGRGSESMIILDHPAGVKLLHFTAGHLDRIEDVEEADTFEEAIQLAHDTAHGVITCQTTEDGERVS